MTSLMIPATLILIRALRRFMGALADYTLDRLAPIPDPTRETPNSAIALRKSSNTCDLLECSAMPLTLRVQIDTAIRREK